MADGDDDDDARGLTEAQLTASLATLQSMAVDCGADMFEVARWAIKGHAEPKFVVDVLVRMRTPPTDFFEVRVGVVGNVDAGKSTLLGVLTRSELDDGRGKCRQKLFRHQHEVQAPPRAADCN